MELLAAIRALQALKRPCSVELHTDSSYLRNAFAQGWLENWQRNGWRTKGGKGKVLNQDLWQELIQLTTTHQVQWHWVKAHAGHPENERADELLLRHGKDSLERRLRSLILAQRGIFRSCPQSLASQFFNIRFWLLLADRPPMQFYAAKCATMLLSSSAVALHSDQAQSTSTGLPHRHPTMIHVDSCFVVTHSCPKRAKNRNMAIAVPTATRTKTGGSSA